MHVVTSSILLDLCSLFVKNFVKVERFILLENIAHKAVDIKFILICLLVGASCRANCRIAIEGSEVNYIQ